MSNPFDQFDGANSSASNPFDQFDAPPANKKQNKGIAGDLVTDLKRGVEQLPSIVTGLADIPVAAITGKPLIGQAADTVGGITGFAPSKWARDAEAEYSPGRVEARRNVDQAWEDNKTPFADAAGGDFRGIGQIAKSYIQNPQQLVGSVVESLPSMVGGAKAGQFAAKTLGVIAPKTAGFVGEGAVMAGQQMDQLSQTDADPRTAAAASAATGITGGVLGALGGKVASKLGVIDPDVALAGGALRGVTDEAKDQTVKGIVKEGAKRVAGGAVSEGAFEELPQSVLEQVLSNLAQSKPWDDGVSRAAVEGTLAGALMGGAFNVMPPKQEKKADAPPAADTPEEKPMLALPAPTYTGTPGDQIIAADSERQAAIDKAQAESNAIWAARDEYERQQAEYRKRPMPTITNDPEPIQRRIDALMGINESRLQGFARTNYEKALENAFAEQIGFVSGKDSLEVPFTMGDYLKSKVAAADIDRKSVAKQPATSGIADAPVIPVVGTLSAAANLAVQSGAHAAHVAQQQAAIQNSQAEASSTKPGKAVTPKTGNLEAAPQLGILAGIAAQAPSIAQSAPNTQPQGQGGMPATAQQGAPVATSPAGVEFDVSKRTNQQLEHLSQHGQPGWKEAAVAEIAKRGAAAPTANSASVPALKASDSAKAPEIPNGDGVTDKPGTAPSGVAPADDGGIKQAPEARKESRGLSVGAMPNTAESVTVKDGVVHIGKYPAQNFDTGEDVTVPAGATDQQIVAALKDAGAISPKHKVFGAEKEAQPAPEDTIGWTRMTIVEREGLLIRAGYGGKGRALNLGGAGAINRSWENMGKGIREKLIAAHEAQFKPADQNSIKTEAPANTGNAEQTTGQDQTPIKKPSDGKMDESAESLAREMAGFTGVSDIELALRQAAHSEKKDGDIELGNGKFITLDQAVSAAKQHMDQADWSKPFQFNRVLDIAPVDWDRMVEAMKSATAEPVSQPKTDAAPEAKQDKAPAITPQHVENGESEPATAAVVEQSLMKGAANSPLDLRQERDLLLKKVDSAIAAAPTAEEKDAWNRVEQRIDLTNNMHVADTIGYRIFDVPGDGKFKVLNLKEALQRFRERVETNPGFRKPISEKPKTVADWQKTGRSGTESTIKELLDQGEYTAAVEYAKQIGKPLIFGQYKNGSSVTVYTEAKPFEREGYDDFKMVSARAAGAADKVAWAIIDLGSGMTVSSGHPTRLKAIAETNKSLEKMSAGDLALAVRSVKANSGFVGTQEELEQRWTEWAAKQEAEAQAKNDQEHRKQMRSHRGMLADYTGKPVEEAGKPAAPPAESHKIDYKGFKRIEIGAGKFELHDGNMVVNVESTGNGKYQASFKSAKSSPHLVGEQGAVDWAASYRNDATKPAQDKEPAKKSGDATENIASSTGKSSLDEYLAEEPGDRNKLNVVVTLKQKGKEELKGTIYAHVENAVKDGHVVVLTRSGPALVDKNMRGWDAKDITPAGMRYANWLISKSQGKTPAVVDSGKAINEGEPRPLDYTPKQYHEAYMSYVAKEYGLSPSEVRNDYDTDVARAERDKEWINAVRAAARDGKEISRQTLDKLHELNSKAVAELMHDYPEAKIPEGYQTPAGRQVEKKNAEEKKADRKAIKRSADAGEELTYNKRNRRKGGLSWEDIADKNAALQAKEVVKAKVYPKPDYQALVDGGMKPILAHIVKQVYDSIAAKPALGRGEVLSEASMKAYIDGVNRVMEGVLKWANDKEAIASWAGRNSRMMGSSFSVMDTFSKKDTPLDFVYPNGWKEQRAEVNYLGGNKFYGALQPGSEELNRANRDLKLGWPSKAESWQKQGYRIVEAINLKAILRAIERKDRAPFVHAYIVKDEGKGTGPTIATVNVAGTSNISDETVQAAVQSTIDKYNEKYVLQDKSGRLVGAYETQESAEDAARNVVKKTKDEGEVKEIGRVVTEVERVGIERRMEGRDVTSDDVKETFGFRGVNFGNSMQGESKALVKERQLHLNHIYDAFMDLAELLNVPPKAMSLNGLLGIAVGAQGSGKALAHFVPGVNEINITRRAGAGALAHEWGHALDHYFANMAGLSTKERPYLTAAVSGAKQETVKVDGQWVTRDIPFDGVRPEIVDQFRSIVRAMQKRNESQEERIERLNAAKEKAFKDLQSWLNFYRREVKKAPAEKVDAALARIDDIERRAKDLVIGDGAVAISKKYSVTPLAVELGEAFESATGNKADPEYLHNTNFYINRMRVIDGQLKADATNEPAIVDTSFYRESKSADGKKKEYWSTPLEMFARAFDAYVVDSLADKESKNEYLGGIEAVPPKGEERNAINRAFDFLFSELKHKETDRGVAVYNIAERNASLSAADKAVYGMSTEGKSASEILKFIVSASRNPLNRQIAKLLLKTGIAPQMAVGTSDGWKFNAGNDKKYAAAYNPKANTVALFRPASAERHVLHELMHAATLKALQKKGLAAAQMRALFDHVAKSGKLKGMYGMSNVDEFVAEAFTNPKFQQALKKVSAPTSSSSLSNAWHWFVRVVRGILGLPANQESALSQALELGVELMRENMRLNEGSADVRYNAAPGKINQTDTEAFKRWFGDSAVVDSDGKPLRVFHGTASDITAFDIGRSGESTGNTGFYGAGAYFSEDADYASGFSFWARRSDDQAPNVVPVYLSLKNPAYINITPRSQAASEKSRATAEKIISTMIARGTDQAVVDKLQGFVSENKFEPFMGTLYNALGGGTGTTALLKEAGFDGVTIYGVISGKEKLAEAVAFDPTQIKSAIGNNGDFDPNNPDIRYNVADEGWSVAEPSKMDDVIYALQDKQIDMKRVVQSIMKTGKQIKDDFNAYLQEELFHGRAAKGVKDFLDFELRPLLAEMQKAGIDMGDFEEYLWNRHAPERNAQIAKINPDMPDGGSGIETAKARAYLAGLSVEQRKTFEALAAKVEAMNRESQRVLIESGLEKQSTIDAWNNAYQHYVPLQREDVDSGHVGTGKGFSVRGSSSKRAMGSGRQVVDIIANLTMQRERNIVRAEKNRVSNALLGLAVQNPNPDFWKVDQAPKERVVEETAIYTVRDESGKKLDEFTRMDEAERFARQHPGSDIEQTWGDRVKERVTPGFTSRDNVLLTRINGEDHYVIFNERDERAMRMAMAMKNLDVDNLGRVLSIVGKATRYLASINTQYNPVFGVINLIRDAQGALINLSSTALAGEQKRVLGYTKDALVGIYRDIRAHRAGKKPSSNWAALFEEFQKEGGQTGYRDQYANAEARAEAIKAELEQFKDGKAKQFTRGLFGWLSDYNETMENAVRLAVYAVAKEKGMSKQQAASLAKNVTVNFNRKGQMATQVGALYAFFNASVQGTARIAETLFEQHGGDIKNVRLSKKGKQIVLGGIMLGSMQALLLAAAGYDDDEPPEFVRERNLILPVGDGKYLTLAMPLGLHVIPGIGRIATEFVLSGGKDPLKRIAAFGSMFADAFNPVGSAGWSLQTITPSVVDPFAALAENKDFTGKEIYREDFNKLSPTPGHARAKDVATIWSRFISEILNRATGGTEFKPGMFSPSPDSIDYLIAQAGGGVMREANKVAQTVGATATGEDLPLYKIPLVGRFVGDTAGQSGQSQKFYEAIKQINMHEAQYKGLIKDGRSTEAREYLAENPAVKLIMAGNHAELAVRKLRTMKRDLVENDADQAQIRAIDDRITATMKAFNERAKAAI